MGKGGQPMSDDRGFLVSSGNVFADLGLANPEEELIKAQLVYRISQPIPERNVTQLTAAEMLGSDQPSVLALVRGRFGAFSIGQSMRMLYALDGDTQVRGT
jgi:predicted XRE-type DNA-binding protein